MGNSYLLTRVYKTALNVKIGTDHLWQYPLRSQGNCSSWAIFLYGYLTLARLSSVSSDVFQQLLLCLVFGSTNDSLELGLLRSTFKTNEGKEILSKGFLVDLSDNEPSEGSIWCKALSQAPGTGKRPCALWILISLCPSACMKSLHKELLLPPILLFYFEVKLRVHPPT